MKFLHHQIKLQLHCWVVGMSNGINRNLGDTGAAYQFGQRYIAATADRRQRYIFTQIQVNNKDQEEPSPPTNPRRLVFRINFPRKVDADAAISITFLGKVDCDFSY